MEGSFIGGHSAIYSIPRSTAPQGEKMIRAFLKFYFHRSLENWRALRRICRDALPKEDRKTVAENGE